MAWLLSYGKLLRTHDVDDITRQELFREVLPGCGTLVRADDSGGLRVVTVIDGIGHAEQRALLFSLDCPRDVDGQPFRIVNGAVIAQVRAAHGIHFAENDPVHGLLRDDLVTGALDAVLVREDCGDAARPRIKAVIASACARIADFSASETSAAPLVETTIA
jgi:hypothetical protein